MRKLFILLLVTIGMMPCIAAEKSPKAHSAKRVQKTAERFVRYAKIDTQSPKNFPANTFPLSEGKHEMAKVLEAELKEIAKNHDGVTVARSEYAYVYATIPANTTTACPAILFISHLDVTPDAPAEFLNNLAVNPIVHYNYDGGDIVLPAGGMLSPHDLTGQELSRYIGQTIITSDGSTLLGADDKSGTTILVTVFEDILNNKRFKHGDIHFAFTQNEDIGLCAEHIENKYFGDPEIVIDFDGSDYGMFSVENFTATERTFTFNGNEVHPGEAKAKQYGDALTAACYFVGQIPPEVHPSASEGREGYIHCCAGDYLHDAEKNPNFTEFTTTIRLRYFDKEDGVVFRSILENALESTKKAYPFVKITAPAEHYIYDNIAYSMYPSLGNIIVDCSIRNGVTMQPNSCRGGTTAAMMVAKGLRGGPCVYAAQHNAHSKLEWTCVEEMLSLADMAKDIITAVVKIK